MKPGALARSSIQLAGISRVCSQTSIGGSLGSPVDVFSKTLIRVDLQFSQVVESPALSRANKLFVRTSLASDRQELLVTELGSQT